MSTHSHGHADSHAEHDHHEHHDTFWSKYVFSTDHKMISKQFLVTAIVMASGSVLKAVGMIFFGLLLGIVGTDVNTGTARFTFGVSELFDGIGFLPVVMGLFGINEVINNLEKPEERDVASAQIDRLWLTKEEFRQAWPASVRGTFLGSILGILPGGGVVLAGQPILDIVPDAAPLEVRARFAPEDIDGVFAGSEAEVRFTDIGPND